jgi:hypothetical protein
LDGRRGNGFKEASIRALAKIELPSPHHLYWPELDIDLAIESVEHPEKYPLVSRGKISGQVTNTKE